MGGDGDRTGRGNHLLLDYFDREGNWINLKRHLGGGVKMSAYAFVEIVLPPGAYHRHFAIRFRTIGKPNSGDWFVDDVRISLPPEITITPTVDPFEFRLNLDDSATAAITLKNEGPGELDFQLADEDGVSRATGKLQPQKAHSTGGRVLWDLSHGVTDRYEPSGQYSRLSALLTKSRYIIETTAGGVDHIDLSAYDVLVVCLGSAWLSAYSASEVVAIRGFVENGGGLLIMGDHLGTHNHNINPLAQAFGITCGRFNSIDLSSKLADHPIFKGVRAIRYAASGEVEAAAPALEVASESDGRGTVAVVTPGRGRVVVTGDIDFCANSYILLESNQLFAENLFNWLAEKSAGADWLTLTPVSGTIAPAANAGITAKINTANLLPGRTYHKNILVFSNDRDEKIVRIPATLHVNPVPHFVLVDPPASRVEDFAKNVVTYALDVFNYGQNSDSYNLIRAGSRWKTQFFDSTGTRPITKTPDIAAGGNFKILVKVTIDSLAAKGMQDTVRITVTSVGDPARSSLAKLITVSRGLRIRITRLPFTEDFSNRTLDSLKWLDNFSQVVVNAWGANEPSPPYSLNLNGTDNVRTRSIDLLGKAGVVVRYAYEMGGNGGPARPGNHLLLDYLDRANNWINLKRHPGGGVKMSAYASDEIILPPGAYHRNFAFRFRTTGKPGSGDWFIDDVEASIKNGPDHVVKLAASTLPENFALREAYPNPFSARGIFNNPGTAIEYELPRDSRVSLQIFDSMGRTVRTLIDGPKPAGYHQAFWNGRNQLGNPVAAGVYLCRMTASAMNGEIVFGKTRRMTLLK